MSTVNGDVRFEGPTADNGIYRVTTHNGDIRVSLGAQANATVFVRTFGGDFSSDFPVTLPDGMSNRDGNKRFNFTLGGGGARVELQSFQGDIHVARGALPARRRGNPARIDHWLGGHPAAVAVELPPGRASGAEIGPSRRRSNARSNADRNADRNAASAIDGADRNAASPRQAQAATKRLAALTRGVACRRGQRSARRATPRASPGVVRITKPARRTTARIASLSASMSP